MTGKMRVWIEQDYCTGDALCADLCSDVFEMGDDGLAHVKGQRAGVENGLPAVLVPEGLEDVVCDAEAECAPASASTWAHDCAPERQDKMGPFPLGPS